MGQRWDHRSPYHLSTLVSLKGKMGAHQTTCSIKVDREHTEIKTSEHGNKWKTSSKGTTKTKQSKKETNKKQTLTAQTLPCHETDQPAQKQQ